MLITGCSQVCWGHSQVVDKIPKSKTTRDSCVFIYNRGLPSSCLVVQQTRDLTLCVWQPTSLPHSPLSPAHHHAPAASYVLHLQYHAYIYYIYVYYIVCICLHIYQCLQTCRLSRMCVTTVSLLSRVCLSRLWMTCLQFACWFVFLFFCSFFCFFHLLY